MNRRGFLAAGSAAGSVIAAGCLGVGGDSADGLTNAPTVVVRRYYAAADDAESQDEFIMRVSGLFHSASPLQEVVETETLSEWQSLRRLVVEQITLVNEGLGTEEIANRSGFLEETIRNESGRFTDKNAVVEASLNVSAIPQSDDSTQIQPWFLATEDGEWKLVWV